LWGNAAMGWKVRNGSRYYYRSNRGGGQVFSKYIGRGPAAELIAEVDRLDALERRREAEAWRAEKEALDAEDLDRARRFGVVETVVRGALEAVGYKRHKRGAWRWPRMKTESSSGPPRPTSPAPIAEIKDVLARVEAGDKPAERRLRELIALDPARMVEAAGGNLAVQVELSRLAAMKKSNKVLGITVPEKLDALRRELGGPDQPPIERLLVERVVMCWLDSHWLELWVAQAALGEVTFRQAEHRDRLRDRAQRRYLSALKALAAVRKLGVVGIQVNIDKQQINLGGG
jgi:hypothetical protein